MEDLLLLVAVFTVASVTGYVLISKVPPLLHTPLMSMTNAVSGVTILGAFLVFSGEPGSLGIALGTGAVLTAAFNVVGGFAITGRMLRLFRRS